MREIKFRCWSILDKKYIDCYDMDMNGKYVHVACGDQLYYSNSDDEPEFILEQYTGHKDKNDKEIYEGDIIMWLAERRNYVVYFNNDMATFSVDLLDTFASENYLFDWDFWESDDKEVMGNVHENTDLI